MTQIISAVFPVGMGHPGREIILPGQLTLLSWDESNLLKRRPNFTFDLKSARTPLSSAQADSYYYKCMYTVEIHP